jgi:regulator of sigma E protease
MGGLFAIVLGLVAMAALVVAMLFAGAAGRWAAARALGVRGVPFPFGANGRWSWTTASVAPQALGIAGSIAATYLTAGALMAAGTWSAGVEHSDAASMRVDVEPGGPADRAGVRDGDRVDAVNGEPVASWDALRGAIARHAGEPVDLELSRGGAPIHAMVTPDRQGRIRVTVPVAYGPASPGECVRVLFAGPAQVLAAMAGGVLGIVAGRERAEVAGPVGIVRVTEEQGRRSSALLVLGGLGAYLVPLLAIPTLFTGPGRRRKRATGH